MDRAQQKQIVEALILAAPEPVPPAQLADIVPGLTTASARQLVAELQEEYAREGRGFELWEVAGGFQIRTRPDLGAWVRQLQRERPLRLSRAALETLAVIAYKQPVTRAEVEHVRGVDAGPVLRSLVERKLVRIAGHREVPGRPMLYATSRRFLEVFGLARLEDLPTLRAIEELLAEQGGAEDDAAATGAEPAQGEGAGDLH
jgi:segregation and condensation protein B